MTTQGIIMTEDMKKDWIKENLLGLALYHKERCDDPMCGIQLVAVREVMNRLGIKLTNEEFIILV